MSPKQSETYYVDAHNWIQPIIIIEDEDLMFGGKTLSAWYEEDRSRLSGSSDDGHQSHSEEERRGRERERRHHDSKKSSKTQRK
ncbi:hypothetical protein PT974_11021 [Cladobotryum mycophilum]|uniref:Uncharacterized protein n=1 Tax=Cladobotryum mycophilum TaxID=491253 RepID=A0ABR0SBF2_9HYPO